MLLVWQALMIELMSLQCGVLKALPGEHQAVTVIVSSINVIYVM